jgi:uncharacterized membrane protein YebE (DUF533 family)
MNMIRTIRVVVFAATSLVAFQAVAQSTAPTYDQRNANQTERINRGEASGQLTQNEAARLREREARLKDMTSKANADGVVTPQERRRLDHAYNQQSKAIARERHDRQHDFNHDGKVDRPRDRAAHRHGAKQ